MSETTTINQCYSAAVSEREAYIHSRVEEQISYYERKSQQNKKIYYALSILTILANAVVPILSIYLPSAAGAVHLKAAIAALSSCATVFSSVMALLGAKDLWTKYRTNAGRLTSFLHQYYSRSGIFAELGDEEAFRLLVRMSEAQIESENKDWGTMLDRTTPFVKKF